jgi:prophage regulatory protein
MAQQPANATPASRTLPADGMSRWNQIAPFAPFSREKFRQLVIAGKAPQPIKLSERCTAYQNRELHKFFADPVNYRPPVNLVSVEAKP